MRIVLEQKTILRKGNSLKEVYPEVANMYDKSGKNKYPSSQISCGQDIEAYFYCDGSRRGLKPHIFKKKLRAEIDLFYKKNRYSNGCPICQGSIVITGVNDFKTVNPEIAALWDYSKNSCRPEDVYFNSDESYHFVCKHGHEFTGDPLHLMRSKGTFSLGCPVCHGKEVISGVNDIYTLFPEKMKEWLWDDNSRDPYNLDPHNVTSGSQRLGVFRCKNCGKKYVTSVCNWTHGFVLSCENCRHRNWSFAEKELAETVASWGLDVVTQYPILGRSYILDIYIPSKKIAVEYNGIYWHSEAVRKDKYYHYNKYEACKSCGITLYCVWEDDYNSKRGLVLRMLRRKLGASNEEHVNARDCLVFAEDYSDVKDFLNKNHVQGAIGGSFYITLREKVGERLRAVAVFKRSGEVEGELNLLRYCTDGIINNGLSEILGAVEKNYIFSYITALSENAISDGSLYAKCGFVADTVLYPSYYYVIGNRRRPGFEFRPSRFRNDPDLVYVDGMSESQLAELNGLERCWDYGKVRWRLNVSSK